MPFRRAAQCRDDRQAVPAIPTGQDRCLTFRSQPPTHQRLEHKPAFIQETDGFTRPAGFFLYAARYSDAIRQWPVHPAGVPAFQASGSSRLDVIGYTRRSIIDTPHRNASGLSELPSLASTSRCCSRWPWHLSRAILGAYQVALGKACMASMVAFRWLMPLGRLFGKHPSSGLQSWVMHRLGEQFRRFPGHRLAIGQPVSFAAQAVVVFLLVSCTRLSVINGSGL